MDTNLILTQIGILKTKLENQNLGKIYDHIPAKPTFPCVIITSGNELINQNEDTGYNEYSLNLNVWIVGGASRSNENIQKELFKKIPIVINKLSELDAWISNTTSQPLPVEYNQTKTLSCVIEGAFIIQGE